RALAPSALAALGPARVPQVDWLTGADLEGARFALTYFALEPNERTFWLEFGQRGIPWETEEGEDRLVTLGALASIQAHGAGSVEGFVRGLRERTFAAGGEPRRVYGRPRALVDTGRRVADVVSLPRRRDRLDAWLAQPGLDLAKGTLTLHPIRRVEGADVAGGPSVLDLERAFQGGGVRLVEGTGDHLVAIVKGLKSPVYVPAGELVAGGRVDRVVARDVWIPAGMGEARFDVPCVAVSSPGGSEDGSPRPTGFMAGPALRAILARGGRPEKVLALVDAQVRPRSLDFSLLTWYDHPALRKIKRQRAALFLRQAWTGFLATDGRGALVGFDVTALPAASAADLLARLALGYEIEAVLAAAQAPRGARAAPQAPPALVTLLDLFASEGTLRSSDPGEGPMRPARLHDARTNVVVDAFGQARGRQGVLRASGFAPAPTP
ncbi:MAG: ARPP-1 family domain-containing protein, partial [Planctomycetota bacterium]